MKNSSVEISFIQISENNFYIAIVSIAINFAISFEDNFFCKKIELKYISQIVFSFHTQIKKITINKFVRDDSVKQKLEIIAN